MVPKLLLQSGPHQVLFFVCILFFLDMNRRGQDPYWKNILKGLVKYKYKKRGGKEERRKRKHA
jgi:hypothetical protein